MSVVDALNFRLLNEWQQRLPLSLEPFAAIAAALAITEGEVLQRLQTLQRDGFISRVGPVFRPHWLGWSTLAAVAVPEPMLERAAALINAHPEVNHNYEREHRWNLWFVVTAPTAADVARVLAEIGAEVGCTPLDLPMRQDYHLDLGFDLQGGHKGPRIALAPTRAPTEQERCIAHALESGLDLVSRPYMGVARACGCPEAEILETVAGLLAAGILRRFGVVVRHRELGYTANAMVVWNIPDAVVDAMGQHLGSQDGVTLCYQRPRRLPAWPYNLFTMVHGQDRAAVLARVEALRASLGDLQPDFAVLFSRRRFKQCGARYSAQSSARLAQAA